MSAIVETLDGPSDLGQECEVTGGHERGLLEGGGLQKSTVDFAMVLSEKLLSLAEELR